MKNLLLFVFALALFACQSTTNTADLQTTFSGQIINAERDKVYLDKSPFTKEISLDSLGNFSVQLTGMEEGRYLFHDRQQGGPVYLVPGKDIHLTVDIADFDQSLHFTGPGAGPSKYLAEHFLNKEKIAEELKTIYAQDEKAFSAFSENNQTRSIALLTGYDDFPAHFVKAERKVIELEALINRQRFVNAKRKAGPSPAYEPSVEFSKTLAAVDLDNATDFEKNPAYNQFVQIRLKSGSMEEVLTRLKTIKSENIRDRIFYGLKSRIRGDSETLDADYERLLAAAPDEKFKQSVIDKYAKVKPLAKGSPSPLFSFENRYGKQVNLEELKGKNVYIDIWATWCGPCVAEIPALHKLAAAYSDDQIEFVSISIDKMKDKGKWLKMIADKNLGGIQLLADKDYETKFIKDYGINAIPRFILLDKKGNIVSTDAPRPSSAKEIKDLFNQLEM